MHAEAEHAERAMFQKREFRRPRSTARTGAQYLLEVLVLELDYL